MGTITFVLGLIISVVSLVVFFKKKLYNNLVFGLILAVVLAVVLEIFTFNYQAFENIGKGLSTSSYEGRIDGEEVSANGNDLILTKNENTITAEIKNINKKVNNVCVNLPVAVKTAEVSVWYKDDVFSDYALSGSEAVVVARDVVKSEIIRLHLNGKAKALKLEIKLPDNANAYMGDEKIITNGSLVLKTNVQIPFVFNVARTIVVLLALFALFYVFKYRNYNFAGDKSKVVRKSAIAFVLVVQIVFMGFLSYAQMDPDTKVYTQEVDPENTASLDQYQQLTMAFAKGQLYLDHLTSESADADEAQLNLLKKLDKEGKVYLPNDRDKATADAGVSYRWDEAYYNGHYYTYYGPVLVVFTFLPVYALFGVMLSTRFVTMLLAIAIVLLLTRLIYLIAIRRKKLNMWTVIGAMVAGMNAIFLTSVFQGAKIYELSPMSGLALVLAGICCLYRTVTDEKPKKWHMIVGALCMALSIGCKPSFMFASLIPGAFVIYHWYKNGIIASTNDNDKKSNKIVAFIKAVFAKNNIKEIICFAIPYVVVGIILMIYNYARFGSPFDFGVAHQLTLTDTSTYSLTDFSKLPAAIYNGLFAMPHTSQGFPFLSMDDSSALYQGFFFKMAGVGIMAFPFMWLLSLTPWVAKQKMSLKSKVDRIGMTDKIMMIVSIIVGLFICYSAIAMGGCSFRYSLDFGWAFVIPSVIILFTLEEWFKKKGVLKQMIKVIMIVVLITVIVNVLLSIGPGFNETITKDPKLYYNMYHAIEFWR